jgi:hypothetical protein
MVFARPINVGFDVAQGSVTNAMVAMAGETNKSKRYFALGSRERATRSQRLQRGTQNAVSRNCCAVPRLGRAARRSRAMAGQTQGPPELNGRKGVMTYLLQKIVSAKVLPERSKAGTACCSSSVMVGSKLAST